eukprot:2109159-Rhodomonas_salina.1
MSGIDIALLYMPMRVICDVRYWHSAEVRYAMYGTDVAYGAKTSITLCAWYAMSSTVKYDPPRIHRPMRVDVLRRVPSARDPGASTHCDWVSAHCYPQSMPFDLSMPVALNPQSTPLSLKFRSVSIPLYSHGS